MMIDTLGWTGSKRTITERVTRIKAISPEQPGRRRHIDAYIVTVGVKAIDRPDFGVGKTQMHHMRCSPGSIESDHIRNTSTYILRGFTGAHICLYHIQAVMCR